jgi:hypothetical protein
MCGICSRLRLKCDGTRAETRFLLSTKRTSPFKSAGASVQSTTGRRAVHISLQGLYCSCKPVFCSHVTHTGYPLHSLVSPSLLLPCVTVCHHISNGVYNQDIFRLHEPPSWIKHLNLKTKLRCVVPLKFRLQFYERKSQYLIETYYQVSVR